MGDENLAFKIQSTLYNVCSVPWEVLSTVGVFSITGDILGIVGGVLVSTWYL